MDEIDVVVMFLHARFVMVPGRICVKKLCQLKVGKNLSLHCIIRWLTLRQCSLVQFVKIMNADTNVEPAI